MEILTYPLLVQLFTESCDDVIRERELKVLRAWTKATL